MVKVPTSVETPEKTLKQAYLNVNHSYACLTYYIC